MTASRASRSFLLARACVLAMACSLAVGCGGDKDPGEAGDGKQAAVGKDGKPAEQKVEAVPVEVARASRRAIAASYTGTANLEAPGEAQVVAKTSGVMVQLLAEEGDQVRAGQVLARIDGDKVRLEVARQKAIVDKLESNYRRSQELTGRKLVSAESSEQLKYDLAAAQAALDLAQLELSYTSIVAPIGGVVAERMVKPGNLIALNAPVFRIVNNSHLEGVLNAPEREMSITKHG